MRKQSGKIGRRREQILLGLLTTGTIKEAADQAQVSVSTIMRALRDADFREALAAARRSLFQSMVNKLALSGFSAASVLSEICTNPTAPLSVRARAASSIAKLNFEGNIQQDLEQRIKRLEDQSNADSE
jgi:DNA-binding MurR/RpiR family transcriptional regulator